MLYAIPCFIVLCLVNKAGHNHHNYSIASCHICYIAKSNVASGMSVLIFVQFISVKNNVLNIMHFKYISIIKKGEHKTPTGSQFFGIFSRVDLVLKKIARFTVLKTVVLCL